MTTSNRTRNLTLALVSIVVSAVVAVAIYEGVENVLYYQWRSSFEGTAWLGTVTVPSDNPVLMWEYRPDAQHKRIRTNNFGLRGPDVSLQRDPSRLRVAFLGDSVTLGYGMEEKDIFIKVFERALSRRTGREIETLNFGVDGYSTLQIAELLRAKVVKFKPDHVVYTMCLNDFDFTTSAGEKVLFFQKPTSFTLIKLEHLWRKLQGLDFHTHKFRQNRDRVFDELLSMKEQAKRDGATFELALLPIFPVDVNSFSYYPHGDIHKEVEVFAKAQGILFTDFLRVFRNAGGPPRAYATDVWHLNEDGHSTIGRRFAATFDKRHDVR